MASYSRTPRSNSRHRQPPSIPTVITTCGLPGSGNETRSESWDLIDGRRLRQSADDLHRLAILAPGRAHDEPPYSGGGHTQRLQPVHLCARRGYVGGDNGVEEDQRPVVTRYNYVATRSVVNAGNEVRHPDLLVARFAITRRWIRRP